MIFSKLKTKWEQYAWERHYQVRPKLRSIAHLYQDVNGFLISKQARASAPSLELTYGEINLYSFLALMSLTKPNANSIFYDLGCGLGKTVLSFALTYQTQKAYGIECLSPLIEIAEHKAKQMPNASQILFKHQDLLHTDIADASIVYLNLATFVPEFWNHITAYLAQYHIPHIVSINKPLALPHYQIYQTRVLTSWGQVPAFIHRPMIAY